MDFFRAVKFYLSIEVNLEKAVGIGETTQPFRTPASELLESTDIEDELRRHINILGVEMDKFVRNGMNQL